MQIGPKVRKTKYFAEAGLHVSWEGDIHKDFHADVFRELKKNKNKEPSGA